jgi:ketosteroid isomerase-like protein
MKQTTLFFMVMSMLVFSGCAEKAGQEADERTFIDFNKQWDRNADEGNLSANADYYTEDGIRVGMGMVLNNKEEIREAFREFEEEGRILENNNKLEKIWVSGDLAAVYGTFEGSFLAEDDTVPGKVTEAGVSLYERQKDGTWKLVLTVYEDLTAANKEVSEMYHELNPDNMDDILADDFVGRWAKDKLVWDKKTHKAVWTENRGGATDEIIRQVAEGNWVATWFKRSWLEDGDTTDWEMMQFKRFKDGKIDALWEYGDPTQNEEE